MEFLKQYENLKYQLENRKANVFCTKIRGCGTEFSML